MISFRASRTPRLRAADGPAFACVTGRSVKGARAAYSATIASVPSVPPSETTTTSKSVAGNVCRPSPSSVRRRLSLRLKVGITTEIMTSFYGTRRHKP